jgi:hypothetical protein
MKPELQALFASLARWVIAFLAGLVGVELVAEQANTAAAVVAVLLTAGVSLWWSKLSDTNVVTTTTK